MLQFMGDNKRLLHLHQQKLSDLEVFKSDAQIFQKNTSASLKNLETQVEQLALNMQTQNKCAFPSDTLKNLKDCMEVQWRSGKEVVTAAENKGRKGLRKNKKKLERKKRRTC